METRLRIVDGRQKEKFRNAAQVALWLTDKVWLVKIITCTCGLTSIERHSTA